MKIRLIVTTKSLTGLLALLFIASVSTHAQRKEFHYWPEKVTLTGRLVLRTFYGPPNYGENPKTDSRETQAILILDSAVNVTATGSDTTDETERNVKRITLVVHDFKANPVRPLLGRHVRVEGTLFHAITGHHHTKVLITVSSIRAAKRGERL